MGCIKKWMPIILAIVFSTGGGIVAAGSPQFTAMFAFGDSLTDPGNNNYLNSLAKANYVPYGVDFDQGPSGRFCNGKTAIDYIGDLLGNPILPAYTSLTTTGKNVLRGVNYASAAGGILEETGRNLGERFSLSQQVENFESTMNQLRSQMTDEEMSIYLSKALVVMCLGSNDYINNYLQPTFYTTSYIYSPKDYADLLINRYTWQILALHSLGLRKFFLGGIGPLGCIPNQLAANLPPPGKCVDYTNNVVGMFNNGLVSLVDQLNFKYNGSVFAYGNIFGAFTDILNNAKIYGGNDSNGEEYLGCYGDGGPNRVVGTGIGSNAENGQILWAGVGDAGSAFGNGSAQQINE
ncbi:GDSL esterase/lipase at5g08460 [Phtheirospermum japonicum]|uniref:GDSL esterase/lipase at5g08460 n=1 Tax=Phtheirospermum japonicum TaxID=374723 RepID=A0A830B9L0_9LAMI|nr:GDSL esterase/lipase at5g08460 [Phtheirospermum japonicum]